MTSLGLLFEFDAPALNSCLVVLTEHFLLLNLKTLQLLLTTLQTNWLSSWCTQSDMKTKLRNGDTLSAECWLFLTLLVQSFKVQAAELSLLNTGMNKLTATMAMMLAVPDMNPSATAISKLLHSTGTTGNVPQTMGVSTAPSAVTTDVAVTAAVVTNTLLMANIGMQASLTNLEVKINALTNKFASMDLNASTDTDKFGDVEFLGPKDVFALLQVQVSKSFFGYRQFCWNG
jgi:hypothetical protein